MGYVEMEKKYLIRGDQNSSEESFKTMLAETKAGAPISDYQVSGFITKKRPYRYFDTFDTRLTNLDYLTFIGPLEQEWISVSTRAREDDYVLALKLRFPKGNIPEERIEHEFPIPAGTNFLELNPNDFAFWSPLKRVLHVTGNQPLQEIIRLEVETYRFNLNREEEDKVQVALDSVVASVPFATCRFYELEIERMKQGEDVDVETVCSFFTEKYRDFLIEDLRPKWIKARSILRERKQ